MDIPILEKNHCSVLIVEQATGVVFKKNLTIYFNGEDKNEVFQIFKSYEEAKDFVAQLVLKHPQFECTIYDHSGKYILTYR